VTGRITTVQGSARRAGHAHFPEVRFDASDDCGGHYTEWPQGGSGDDVEWRFVNRFGPALRHMARELRLEVASVRWRGAHEEQAAESTPGPWRFTVPLPAGEQTGN
jgi:hypothetical protein